MGAGRDTSEDLLRSAQEAWVREQSAAAAPETALGSQGAEEGSTGLAGSEALPSAAGGVPHAAPKDAPAPALLEWTDSGNVLHPDDDVSQDEGFAWTSVHSQAARGAAMLIEHVRSKANKAGKVSKKAFAEALEELLGGYALEAGALDQLFSALDTDGSQSIDSKELNAAIQYIIDPESDSALEKLMMMDDNALAASVQRLRTVLASQAARTIDMFKKWDTDGDGMLTKEEFKVAIKSQLGFSSMKPSELDALFAAFDADGSGEISFREMHKMLRVADPVDRKPKAAAPPVELVDLQKMRLQMMHDVIRMNVRCEMRGAVRKMPAVDDLEMRESIRKKRTSAQEGVPVEGVVDGLDPELARISSMKAERQSAMEAETQRLRGAGLVETRPTGASGVVSPVSPAGGVSSPSGGGAGTPPLTPLVPFTPLAGHSPLTSVGPTPPPFEGGDVDSPTSRADRSRHPNSNPQLNQATASALRRSRTWVWNVMMDDMKAKAADAEAAAQRAADNRLQLQRARQNAGMDSPSPSFRKPSSRSASPQSK